jgi:hypothetical protein
MLNLLLMSFNLGYSTYWDIIQRNELSLSIFAGDQVVKLGTSVDYCICKGLRKDGMPCSTVVNR